MPTSTAKSFTIEIDATDNAGNQAQPRSRSYTVFASWSGPVDAPPAVNTVKAGAGVPVVFGLQGNRSLNIFDTGYPKSQSVACDTWTGDPIDPIESTVSTPGGLSYNATTDQYTYVWKTTKTWTGCRQLILRFAPDVPNYGGAQAVFNFKFK